MRYDQQVIDWLRALREQHKELGNKSRSSEERNAHLVAQATLSQTILLYRQECDKAEKVARAEAMPCEPCPAQCCKVCGSPNRSAYHLVPFRGLYKVPACYACSLVARKEWDAKKRAKRTQVLVDAVQGKE